MMATTAALAASRAAPPTVAEAGAAFSRSSSAAARGPVCSRRADGASGRGLACVAGLLLLCLLVLAPSGAQALELCSGESKVLMRSVGITEGQISELCAELERAHSPFALNIQRRQDELGYCRITLALTNNSTQTLDVMVIAAEDADFELFRFGEVRPGGTGYASGRSRELMLCRDLDEHGVVLRWPASLRIAGRSPGARLLQRSKPLLMDPALKWNR